DAIKCMYFTPDMEIITTSLDGILRAWNIEVPNAIEGPNAIKKAFPAPRHDSKETLCLCVP
ncbi:transducin beta-like protein 2, partial [Tanacetum coccineum]